MVRRLGDAPYLMMLFVQQRLYEGLQPNKDGDYTIKRKEFIERIPLPASTFDNNVKELTKNQMKAWSLFTSFGLVIQGADNLDNHLYVDVRYEHGQLKFKRHPVTLRPELAYTWARRPNGWEERVFTYGGQIPVPDGVSLPITLTSNERALLRWKWTAIPHEGVGPVKIGMSRRELRDNWYLNAEFKKTQFSTTTTDDFGLFHVYYDANDCCEAIEVFDDVEVYIDGKVVYPIPVNDVCEAFHDFKADNDGAISVEKAVGIYAPEDKPESILFGNAGYFDF